MCRYILQQREKHERHGINRSGAPLDRRAFDAGTQVLESRGHRATDAFTGLQWSRPIHPPQGDEDIFFRESAVA